MEIDENLKFIIASFCEKEKILQYFKEFLNVLKESRYVINSKKMTVFLNFVHVFTKKDTTECNNLTTQDNTSKEITLPLCNDLNDILLSILETFCFHHMQIILQAQNNSFDMDDISTTLDAVAYLIKLYIHNTRCKKYIAILVQTITCFFKDFSLSLKNFYTNLNESEMTPLYLSTLKFLAKILKSLPCTNSSEYLSSELILNLIEMLHFPDTMTVKIYVNHILPTILQFAQPSFKFEIFKSMWNLICTQYNEEERTGCSEINFCTYTMLCSLTECMYDPKNQEATFLVHNEIIFWKIVLSGLKSSLPFTRKKSLNVFKGFLLWMNTNGDELPTMICPTIPTRDVVKIWQDVVILFESFEEKQIHVIKPVLPKFSRVLMLSTKELGASTVQKFNLSTELILALINRMLKHETKFVVKWALTTVLNIDFRKYPIHQHNSEVLMEMLVQTINDQTLYSRNNEQDNYSLFLSSEKIKMFMNTFMSSLESESEKVDLTRSLVSITASQSWCAVALLHFMHALTGLGNVPSWNPDDFLHIRKIIMDCQRSQEPVFRAALEYFLIECCTLFLDWNVMGFENLMELLAMFQSNAALRHSGPWNKFALRLSAVLSSGASVSLTYDNLNTFSLGCLKKILKVNVSDADDADIKELEILKCARMLVMLNDSCALSSSTNVNLKSFSWSLLLSPMMSTLQSAPRRPYMSNKEFFGALKLLTLLIKESKGCQILNSDVHTSCIVEQLQNTSEMVEYIYQKLFFNVEGNDYIFQNNILLETLHAFSAEPELIGTFKNIIPKLIDKIHYLLTHDQCSKNVIFPLWRLLNYLVVNDVQKDSDSIVNKLNSNYIPLLNSTVLLKVTSEDLLNKSLSRPLSLDSIEKEQWLQFTYSSICDFWDVSRVVVGHLSNSELSSITLSLSEEALKVFSNGPKIAVPHVIDCMSSIIPELGSGNLNTLSKLLDSAWKACLELRGNEAFRPALNSFIRAIFQSEMLQKNFFGILHNYLEKFKEISETTGGIYYNAIKQFCDAFSVEKLLSVKFDCVPLFVNVFIFGPIHQKAHKIMEETILYFMEGNSELSNQLNLYDSNKPSCYVRIKIIKHLLKSMNSKCIEIEEFLHSLIMQLLKVDIDEDGKQSSHFANSFSHRIRNRAWQAIILLQSGITTEDLNEQILLKTLDTLGSESQQPSIRYLQEWVIFNILRAHQNLLDKYILVFEQSMDRRPSYIISILSVINLLILHKIILNEKMIITCFKLLTVLCMAQNFTVRLYAQLALTKLYTMCQKDNIGGFIQQYEYVSQMLKMQTTLAGQGNFFKNVLKLSNDFYFSSFSPIAHFSLETVFNEFPRLSNLSPDEWIQPTLFGKENFSIPTYNSDDRLKHCNPTSWSSKKSNELEADDNNSLDYNFQKKIIPVKAAYESGGCLDSVDVFERRRSKDGLIVVASLIDRIPNLGGLCRTCEVFGVSELVIGNLRYTEDKQFQTLAVSADKWVSIKEVKPHQLKEYLTSMKEQGYVLVGAEQTEDSVNLNEYQFPKKTVLLLGHEKEGLSVDLIRLLDACVEIPQQGVVRSLNVHVSGAILIWEYARQHSKSN